MSLSNIEMLRLIDPILVDDLTKTVAALAAGQTVVGLISTVTGYRMTLPSCGEVQFGIPSELLENFVACANELSANIIEITDSDDYGYCAVTIKTRRQGSGA